MRRRRIRPSFVLFADVGDERPETYEFIEQHMRPWLRSVGFPDVTVVRYEPKRFKHGPYSTLFENCMVNSTLPSLAFGRKACSNKWKIAPMDKWVRQQYGEHLAEGNQIARCIGYDAGPKDSCRGGNVTDCDDFVYLYPLREWGWDREQCKLEIAKEGLVVPPKSACFFCPSTQKDELVQLAIDHPELARKAVEMEDRAQPNLKAIEGLWRNGVKGTRKPEAKRPGRWREYLEQEGYGHLFEGAMAAKDTKMIEVEYYRCWPGNGGDSGTWDTDFIEIPADTPDDKLDAAVREACQKVDWREQPPAIVGYYCESDPLEDDDGD